jgi:hypothetical protein
MRLKFDVIPANEDNLRQLMRAVRKTLPPEAGVDLDTPITMDELRDSVKRGKTKPRATMVLIRNYLVMWDTIKHELLQMVNQMYDTGISDNQKHGVVCVPKKPRPTRPEDFRHLTLLNADLKLLTRILAKRLSPWLHTLLHHGQHCGINGRTSYEALATIREAIACTEYARTSMCILSLDFRNAFDNISHEYLSNYWKSVDLVLGSSAASGICTGMRHHRYMLTDTGQVNSPLSAPCGKAAH